MPSSTKAYLPESCDKAVMVKVLSSFSFTPITRHVVVSKLEVSKMNGACWFGAALNAEETVIVVPDIPLIVFCSKLPSGKILKGDPRKEFEIERIKIDLKLFWFMHLH